MSGMEAYDYVLGPRLASKRSASGLESTEPELGQEMSVKDTLGQVLPRLQAEI